MVVTLAELIVILFLALGIYFAISPLRRRLEWALGQWLRNKFGDKSERPIIDLNKRRK
ncbi:MAG: hypothetical protein HQ462_03455 [Deltaproteobacteria bacterium]|nr:hypothetical protein [Deltaproteobacteria bacterium]